MDNMVEELEDIYDQLQSFVEKSNKNRAIRSLEKLESIASEIGKSWSGSWIGYQSRVYYKDFVAPPAGAHFSSEWGFYENVMRDTQGAWTEYQFDYVQEYIKNKAGNPDTKQASDITKWGRELFREKQNALLSIFETYLLRRKDTFIERLIEKVKPMKIPSNSDWVETIRPHSIMSRDSLALTQGITTPPHVDIIADVFDIRSPIYMCEELAKHAKTATSHIERQDREVRRMERVGTNVFIGHGRSLLWKDLKDFIQDRLRLPWDEYNRVPVAGITNISRLSEMLDSAVIAFLVMTAEDEQADGKLRARMNVIHEAGLFQGRLGFTRSIILLEEGCEEFSNIQGLGQIRFPKGNIKAAFEEVRLVLEREGIIDSQTSLL
jgi:predicted nucleotide-binding protein